MDLKSPAWPPSPWQNTTQGNREVWQALRRTLLKYLFHTGQDLFDKAYGYIREYY